jgi:hypothetical protein
VFSVCLIADDESVLKKLAANEEEKKKKDEEEQKKKEEEDKKKPEMPLFEFGMEVTEKKEEKKESKVAPVFWTPMKAKVCSARVLREGQNALCVCVHE